MAMVRYNNIVVIGDFDVFTFFGYYDKNGFVGVLTWTLQTSRPAVSI